MQDVDEEVDEEATEVRSSPDIDKSPLDDEFGCCVKEIVDDVRRGLLFGGFKKNPKLRNV